MGQYIVYDENEIIKGYTGIGFYGDLSALAVTGQCGGTVFDLPVGLAYVGLDGRIYPYTTKSVNVDMTAPYGWITRRIRLGFIENGHAPYPGVDMEDFISKGSIPWYGDDGLYRPTQVYTFSPSLPAGDMIDDGINLYTEYTKRSDGKYRSTGRIVHENDRDSSHEYRYLGKVMGSRAGLVGSVIAMNTAGTSSGSSSGGMAQIDLRNDLSGTYTLNANTLYLLPDTGSVDGGLNIHLNDTSDAHIWEMLVKYTGGSIQFDDTVDVGMFMTLIPNTYYDIRIIDGHASIKAVGNPGRLYLYNIDAEDQQCTDVSGGWMIAPNAGAYRLYTGSGNPTVFQITGSGIRNQCYRTSAGDGYGGGMTANEIDFNALRYAGYTKICLQIELQENGSSQTQSVYVISGTERTAVQITTFNIGNYAQCYGSYEHSTPTIITTQAIRTELPIPAAERGYVGYLVHNNNGNGLKTSYVKRVWIE